MRDGPGESGDGADEEVEGDGKPDDGHHEPFCTSEDLREVVMLELESSPHRSGSVPRGSLGRTDGPVLRDDGADAPAGGSTTFCAKVRDLQKV